MKARIASELRRTNITSQIADAINTAINQLEAERWYFNESRDFTFNTVDGQDIYDGDDSAFIPRILKFDYVKIAQGDNIFTLGVEPPERIEWLNQNSTSRGMPLSYCYYGEQIRLSYVPDTAYEIRVAALVKMPAPADDTEANNPWMVKAEKLVRSYAKWELYSNVLMDPDKALMFSPENPTSPTAIAMRNLKNRTNDLTQQGGYLVTPTCW